MAKDWWIKFEIHSWLNDPRRRKMSRQNSDSWLTSLLLMEIDDTYLLEGAPRELANMLNLTAPEFKNFVDDLIRTKTADVQKRPGNVQIVCRRLKRQHDAREYDRLAKRRQRRNQMSDECPDTIVISNKKEVRKREEDAPPKADANAKPKADRGSRIPDPFLLTPEMRKYAADKRPGVNITEETEKFCNYYRSQPGAKGSKLDWAATWRNWILNARTVEHRSNGSKPADIGKHDPTADPIAPKLQYCEICKTDTCLRDHRFDLVAA